MDALLCALPSTGGGYKGTKVLQKSQSVARAPDLHFHPQVAGISRGVRAPPGLEHSPERQVCNHSGGKEGPAHLPPDRNLGPSALSPDFTEATFGSEESLFLKRSEPGSPHSLTQADRLPSLGPDVFEL